jgi:hypothetical protein
VPSQAREAIPRPSWGTHFVQNVASWFPGTTEREDGVSAPVRSRPAFVFVRQGAILAKIEMLRSCR